MYSVYAMSLPSYGNSESRSGSSYDMEMNLNESNCVCQEDNSTISSMKCDSLVNTPIKANLQISYNPFEVKPETLHLQSCSPSVFATFQTTDKKTKTFRWSIDQIATLRPAEIDETSQQETQLDLDMEMEEKAQKAIETFFSRNNVVPSPWGTLAKHVIFSPNLASTAYYTNAEESLNVSQVSCSSQNVLKKNVWTQTYLTVPPLVNLMDILGPAFAFHGDCCQTDEVIETTADTDSFGNSSLRRKLFSPGNESTPTGVLQKIPPSTKLWTPPVTPQTSVPPEEDSHICTPSSAQFSSSPITPRNCSISMGVHASPPTVSPIGKSVFKTPSTGSRSDGIDLLPDSSSSTNNQGLVGRKFLQPSPMNLSSPNDGDLKSTNAIDCSVVQTRIQKPREDIFQHSLADMSCDESINNNSDAPAAIENVHKAKFVTFDFLKEPSSTSNCQEMESQELKKDDHLDSNLNSIAQDTGYQSASLQSITSNSNGGLRSELGIIDSVVMPNSVHYENINIFHNEIDKDCIHGGMQGKDVVKCNGCKTNVQPVSFQEQYSTAAFNPLPWQPTKCSTPTKMHLSEIL